VTVPPVSSRTPETDDRANRERRTIGIVLGAILALFAALAPFVVMGVRRDLAPEVGRNLLELPAPETVSRFELATADGAVLWRIEARPAAAVTEILYGQTPAGFAQTMPGADARPRMLRPGEPLVATIVTDRGTFAFAGPALSPTGFRGAPR